MVAVIIQSEHAERLLAAVVTVAAYFAGRESRARGHEK
jgi:hypothetical protein